MQKIVYSETFHCTHCDRRLSRMRYNLNAILTFAWSRHTHCIRCGTPNVHGLKKRDRIDSVSYHPASLLLALTGAPLRRCPSCRLQYHDWRRPADEIASS
jgi:hypothetical protein